MKVGNDEVNVKNGFKLLWKGLIGLFMVSAVVANGIWRFSVLCGKVFLKLGESYSKSMDMQMKYTSKKNRKVYK